MNWGAIMKIGKQLTIAILLAFFATPSLAAVDDAKALGQFQEIVKAIERRSFEQIKDVFDQTDMMNRVYSHRAVEPDVRDYLRANFQWFVESEFSSSIPPEEVRASVDLIEFSFQDGVGRAAVRYGLLGHSYAITVFELRHDRRGRLVIVEWIDTRAGSTLSAQISDSLLTIKPNKEATRKLLAIKSPSDLELFQFSEILKADRDREPTRFFEIYDDLDEQLKREVLIVRRAVKMALRIEDMTRMMETLEIYVEVSAEDPNLGLMISEIRIALGDYEAAYTTLQRFHQSFWVQEGAIPAKLSALALAIGKLEEAEKFGLEATIDEPELELGWWSLLRARAASQDYEGSLEALTYLEDEFGHRLDEVKLRRDKFRGFVKLAESQEFKDWRASRD